MAFVSNAKNITPALLEEKPIVKNDAFYQDKVVALDYYQLKEKALEQNNFRLPSVLYASADYRDDTGLLEPLDIIRKPPEPDRVKHVKIDFDLSEINNNKLPTIDQFIDVIFDGDSYPLDAKYMDADVLLDSYNLGLEQGYELIYERTAPPPGGKSRHFIMAMRVVQESDKRVRIDWHSLSEDYALDHFPAVFAADPEAIYTPYNHGSWTLDLGDKPKITYQFDVDPGGRVPLWMIPEDMLLAFPKKVLSANWGIEV
ncbi:hypothetical protein KJ708_04600 [bacterium]|nr:hypothetical protein [bacterium]